MALATQCPHCYTSFRVANDQLKLHAGMVRCGACKQTFNGIEHLLAPGVTPKSPPTKTLDPETPKLTGTQSSSPSITNDSAVEVVAEVEVAAEAAINVSPATNANPVSHAISDADEVTDVSAVVPTINPASINLASAETATSKASEVLEPPIDSPVVNTPLSEISNYEPHAFAKEIESAEANIAKALTETNLRQLPHITSPDLTTHVEIEQVNASSQQDLGSSLVENLPAAPVLSVARADFTSHEVDLSRLSENLKQVSVANELDATIPIKKVDAIAQTATSLSGNDTSKIHTEPAIKKPANKPGALTASLDFELSKEDREWVDEIAQVHQLELETRAAVLNETTDEWSNHEPQSVQDGFIDSLKELKPPGDIGELGSDNHQPALKSNIKHQTLDDLRISSAKTDSLTDQDVSSDMNEKDDVKDPEVTPAFVLQAERAQRFGKWKRFGLGLCVFLFVLAGAAQSIYFLRSDIAALAPQLKPQLLSICKALSCQIKLPAQKSMLEITGSELLIVNEELSMNTLSVQIQNKSNTVQAWPHFDLALKDRRGKDLLQKAFAPNQYLENKELLSKGMTANSESSHKIFFQLNGLKASDYTVEVFYP
jgi:predicted Zn finger-like uncharacterized protein